MDHDERNENASELMQAWMEYEAEQELQLEVENDEQSQLDCERLKKEFDEREQFNSDEYAFDTDLLNEF